MADIIAAVPHFWLLAALSLAALGNEAAILGVSLARLARQGTASRTALAGDWRGTATLNAPSRLLEILAATIPLAVAAPFVRVIQSARDSLASMMTSQADPSDKARRVSQALSAELNATPMSLWAVGAAVVLGSVAVAAAVSARRRARGLLEAARLAAEAPTAAAAWLKFPGPKTGHVVTGIGAFLSLGFAPMAEAAFAAVIVKIRAFASVASAPPQDKGALFSRALDDASRLLDQRLVMARFGIVVAAVIAAFLVWRFSPARARAQLLGATERPAAHRLGVGIAIALCTIAVAVGGFVAARPMRAENQLPWPPYEGSERLMAVIATPDLEGPDEMERAPVIHLTQGAMGLDGREADADAIAMELNTLSRFYAQLRPNEPFNGQVLIACQADTSIDRLSEALRAAVSGGMPHATFVFLRRQVADRPLLGHRWRNRARAARTTVVESKSDVDSDATTVIPVDRSPTCAALSRDIVAARRAGHQVALLLAPLR